MIAKSKTREFLRIVDWDEHLHPDLTRKVKPPFRWIKLQTENLDTLGDLTLREYGAYCRLLGLAALTNNRIVFAPKVIQRRTGITPKVIEKLQKRCLIEVTKKTDHSEKLQEKQGNDSKTASGLQADCKKTAAPEGRGRDKNRFDLNTPTPRASRPAGGENSELKLDSRDFGELKEIALKAVTKFSELDCDDDELWRFTAASLRMSRRQFDECMKQLRQDGEL